MGIPSDKERLTDFFRTEYRKLLGFVRFRIDEIAAQDAQDFVHDVVLQLFDHADVAAPIENLSAYVYRSLRNRMVDYFRQRKPLSLEELLASDSVGDRMADWSRIEEQQADHPIARMESAYDLRRLLEKLSEEERLLIEATEIQGHSFADLSEAWQVPVNTLLSRKARALAKIRKHVEEEPHDEE